MPQCRYRILHYCHWFYSLLVIRFSICQCQLSRSGPRSSFTSDCRPATTSRQSNSLSLIRWLHLSLLISNALRVWSWTPWMRSSATKPSVPFTIIRVQYLRCTRMRALWPRAPSRRCVARREVTTTTGTTRRTGQGSRKNENEAVDWRSADADEEWRVWRIGAEVEGSRGWLMNYCTTTDDDSHTTIFNEFLWSWMSI